MQPAAELVSVEEAQRIVAEAVSAGGPLAPEQVALADAVGRTLAEPVHTDIDDPPFDRALMDGYAVRSGDFADGQATLTVVGSLGAGAVADRPVGVGQALQINTGAPVPPGADAVVRVERTELADDGATVRVTDQPVPGQSITPRATHLRTGEVVLEAGTRLGPPQIAAAAAAGAATVIVHRRPRVGVLVTGQELVAVDAEPGAGQIRNSNGYGLIALVQEAGCQPENLGVAADDRASLAERIEAGLACDVLCTTGGISMGQYDLVPDVLRDHDVRFGFRKVKVKPGKPTIFGVASNGGYVFALPGNPVSCFVGFWLYVAPLLRALQGGSAAPPAELAARLHGSLRSGGDRLAYIPASLWVADDGHLEAAPVAWHGSGDPFGLARANGLIVREPSGKSAESGTLIRVLPLSLWNRTDA